MQENEICCLLKEILEQGFGDPLDSIVDIKTLSAKYTLVVTAPRVSVLVLENTGAIDIHWVLDSNSPIVNGVGGKKLAATGKLVLDRFRGTLYARGATAGATLEIALLTSFKPLGGL